jgi:hypothetical protein
VNKIINLEKKSLKLKSTDTEKESEKERAGGKVKQRENINEETEINWLEIEQK